MARSRSRSPGDRRRERRRSRSRERRHRRDRDRSRSRERRRRADERDERAPGARSPDGRREDRSRSRSRDRGDRERRAWDKEREKRKREKESTSMAHAMPGMSGGSSSAEALTDKDFVGKTDEEIEMMKVMGFGNFDTSKGKKVKGNDVGDVHVVVKRKYRQYMNRKGGFNRPLDYVH